MNRVTQATDVTRDSVTFALSQSHVVTMSCLSPEMEKNSNMNHTQRIAYVARQRRYLTKVLVREAVERYLEVVAEDIAGGEWVDLPGIGKIQVILEEVDGMLTSFGKDGKRVKRRVTHRLRTRFRLYERFKASCRQKSSLK